MEASNYLCKVLEVIIATKENFRDDYIKDILIGRATDEVCAHKHNDLEEFGCGDDVSEKIWYAVIRQALIAGYLKKDVDNYGVLKVTDKGRNFLDEPVSFKIVEDRDFDEEEIAVPPQSGAACTVDPALYQMLKDLRKKVAKKHGLPPFVIFQDPSLEDMSVQYPITLEEMQNITGVGVGKARKFGEEFVKLIKAYVEEKEIIRPQDMIVKSVGNKSGNKIFIIQSIDRKMDFEDIARAKDLDFDELLTEIEGIVNSGTKLDISYYIREFMDEDKADDIYLYFKEDAESDSLDVAIKELGPDYTEEEIRLVRIKFICEQGN